MKRAVSRAQRLAVGAAILWELFLPPHKSASQVDLENKPPNLTLPHPPTSHRYLPLAEANQKREGEGAW